MLGARILCSALFFLASAQGQTTGTLSPSPCEEVCVVAPCNACSETGLMSILPIFISGTILSTGTDPQNPSASSTIPPTLAPSSSAVPSTTTSFSVSILPTSVSGVVTIPSGETLLPTRPGPPSFNGTSLRTTPTLTATVSTTSSGTSQSSGAASSSAAGNSSASKISGQCPVVAAAVVALGFAWALL